MISTSTRPKCKSQCQYINELWLRSQIEFSYSQILSLTYSLDDLLVRWNRNFIHFSQIEKILACNLVANINKFCRFLIHISCPASQTQTQSHRIRIYAIPKLDLVLVWFLYGNDFDCGCDVYCDLTRANQSKAKQLASMHWQWIESSLGSKIGKERRATIESYKVSS